MSDIKQEAIKEWHKSIEMWKQDLYFCKKYNLPTDDSVRGLKHSIKCLSYWMGNKTSEDVRQDLV